MLYIYIGKGWFNSACGIIRFQEIKQSHDVTLTWRSCNCFLTDRLKKKLAKHIAIVTSHPFQDYGAIISGLNKCHCRLSWMLRSSFSASRHFWWVIDDRANLTIVIKDIRRHCRQIRELRQLDRNRHHGKRETTSGFVPSIGPMRWSFKSFFIFLLRELHFHIFVLEILCTLESHWASAMFYAPYFPLKVMK